MRHQRGQELGVRVFAGLGFARWRRRAARGRLGHLGRRRSGARGAGAWLGRRCGDRGCSRGGHRFDGRVGQVQGSQGRRERGRGRWGEDGRERCRCRCRGGTRGHGRRGDDSRGHGARRRRKGLVRRRMHGGAARLPLRHRHQGQGHQTRAQAPSPSACGRRCAGACRRPRAGVERAQDADAEFARVGRFRCGRPRRSGSQQAWTLRAWRGGRAVGGWGVHGHGGDSVAALSM